MSNTNELKQLLDELSPDAELSVRSSGFPPALVSARATLASPVAALRDVICRWVREELTAAVQP